MSVKCVDEREANSSDLICLLEIEKYTSLPDGLVLGSNRPNYLIKLCKKNCVGSYTEEENLACLVFGFMCFIKLIKLMTFLKVFALEIYFSFTVVS